MESPKVEETPVDTGKKTTVEPPEEVISKTLPIWEQTEIYPDDVLYPQEGKLVAKPVTQIAVQPYLYDKLPVYSENGFSQSTRIDYGTGRYNQDVMYDYAEKDIANIRLNQLLYA